MRDRLIELRLTPNAISLAGFVLNVAAAGLGVGRLFFLAGVAFIVGSIMDKLDGRYSRMSGNGTPFGAFLDSTTPEPRLSSTPHEARLMLMSLPLIETWSPAGSSAKSPPAPSVTVGGLTVVSKTMAAPDE